MGKHDTHCKYCGAKITGGTTCGKCNEKLTLVRKLLRMVKDAKEQVEREKRIQEDLRRVRNNDR